MILILLIIPVVALLIDRLFFFVQAELFQQYVIQPRYSQT